MGDSDLFDLSGRVAIVTGSTKGIGRAMAEGLAASGASVVVSSRKQEACETVAAEIQEATGSRALGIACHVGDWDAVGEFIADVKDQLGRIDVLVNNAGINPARIGPADMTLDYWRKIFAVNVEGPAANQSARRSDHAGSRWRKHRQHRLHGGILGRCLICAYAASKAALINLTKSMAQDWASWKVRVNALSLVPF